MGHRKFWRTPFSPSGPCNMVCSPACHNLQTQHTRFSSQTPYCTQDDAAGQGGRWDLPAPGQAPAAPLPCRGFEQHAHHTLQWTDTRLLGGHEHLSPTEEPQALTFPVVGACGVPIRQFQTFRWTGSSCTMPPLSNLQQDHSMPGTLLPEPTTTDRQMNSVDHCGAGTEQALLQAAAGTKRQNNPTPGKKVGGFCGLL